MSQLDLLEEEASRTIAEPPQPEVGRQALPAPYATAWAVAREHGLRLAVAEEMRRGLSAAFDGLTAAPLSALLRQPPCQRHNLSEEQVLHNEWYQLPSPAPPVQMVQWARRHHLPVVLRKHLFVPELAAAWLDELRKEFHFRPDVQMVADEKLNNARTQVAEMAGCNHSQVCTVGVHVRRTDYGPYMRKLYPRWEEAGVEYYRAAAAEMLRALPARCAGVAFLVTSDDPRWCRRRLLPALRADAHDRSPVSAVFLRSSKDAVDDLCLLASCEHTIINYGTFGTLAAMLAGGRVILYDMTQHGVRHRNPSSRIADYLPQWNALS
ncbi:galactoside 2-alpha-L-fucosyltransferase SEC1-like [Schistocerca americana]|uniref:galactoside 2-alpha-L-fucosyltransferase SEC1-like n=1 Tax=Schistocerca americana TaxID=7009 RepID=UPI001F4F8F03|nr:galactoside 2-alpha-L-fucosyltransferase SEC1-like [Schistocerca americana]